QVPEYLYVSWAIFDVLDLLPAADRVALLEKLFRVTEGVGTAADVLVTIKSLSEREKNKYPEFDGALITRLQQLVVTRINELATSQDLLDKDFLPKILYSWKTWGDPSQEATYIEKAIAKDHDLIRFLDKFIYQTTSIGGGEKIARVTNKFSIARLAQVIDLSN